MKTIVLFPTIGLPIPSVMGGAVETLITDLIDENEMHKQYRFVVVSGWCEGIEAIQAKYKYTQFVVVKERFYDKFLFFVYRAIKKLTKCKIAPLFLSSQNYRAFLKLKKMEFDYLVCEGGYYRNFYDIAKTFGHEKMICHLHSEFVPDDYIRNAFSSYIAISQFIKDRWDTRLHKSDTPTYVLRNCINIKRFLANKDSVDVKAKYNIPRDAYLIAYVGRIIPIKGVEQLINAFLKCHIPNKRLMLIGSTNFGGSEISDYERRIQEKVEKHIDSIVITGFIPNDQLSAYLSRANLVVMPSLCQEGAGLVAVETLATGVDLLATESGGIQEFAKDGYCYKISKDEYFKQDITTDIDNNHVLATDWEAFEEKLSNMLDGIALGAVPKPRSALEYIHEFDSEQYYKNFDKIIKEIDNGRTK